MPEILALASLVLAAFPAALSALNLRHFRAPPAGPPGSFAGRLSVLIPARDEEASITRAVSSVRANSGADVEIVVMDDHSEDATAELVQAISRRDRRVRLVEAPPLPNGWCGKQHACYALAAESTGDVMLFMDADVELSPDAIRRILSFLDSSGADLVSGFPLQRTGSFLERLLIPLIHFVLLGFLPIFGMRRSPSPAYAAGCGQLVAVRRDAYERSGGHRAIRSSRHDGIMLPRSFRRAGSRTDLFDATRLAACRMYRGASEVWNGLAKNATEGMATPAGILPWTVVLLGGQVLPPLMLAHGLLTAAPPVVLGLATAATTLGIGTRVLLALRFRQSWLGVLLHPLSVVLLVAVQWYALARETVGRPVAWKGRAG